jgi:hypothetical protein
MEILFYLYTIVLFTVSIASVLAFNKLYQKHGSIIVDAFPIKYMKTVTIVFRLGRIRHAIDECRITNPEFIKDFQKARIYRIITIVMVCIPILFGLSVVLLTVLIK